MPRPRRRSPTQPLAIPLRNILCRNGLGPFAGLASLDNCVFIAILAVLVVRVSLGATSPAGIAYVASNATTAMSFNLTDFMTFSSGLLTAACDAASAK